MKQSYYRRFAAAITASVSMAPILIICDCSDVGLTMERAPREPKFLGAGTGSRRLVARGGVGRVTSRRWDRIDDWRFSYTAGIWRWKFSPA
jgi:hypothetical protein